MVKDYQRFIHECFYQIAAEHSSKIALILSTQQLTYAELNQQSNRLAHFLLSKHLKPDDRVVIVLEKSIDFFVSLLAVLKSGCAFVLIEIPQLQDVQNDRFQRCLDGARSQDHGFCILAQSKHQALLGACAQQTIYLDDRDIAAAIKKCSADNISADSLGLSFENLAYITFTSGSSGFPKGPMIEHDALFARFLAHQDLLHVKSDDRVAQFAPVHIDACIMEFLMAWMVGATLVIVPSQLSSEQLKQYYRQQGITVSIFTPSVLSDFSPQEFPALRAILTTGEAVSVELLRMWSSDGRIAINGYGPSETTIGATLSLYSGADSVSIGISMLGTDVCILPRITAENLFDSNDPRQLQALPEDQSGEICMMGAGVARGYCNDPEQAQQRFFTLTDGRRLYRSGDGGFLRRGEFYIEGRLDRQLKKYGRLIAPYEVESAIKAFIWKETQVKQVMFDKEKTTGLLIARVKLNLSSVLSREDGQRFVTALAVSLTHRLDRFLYPQRWWIEHGDEPVGNWKMQLKEIPWAELYVVHTNPDLNWVDVAEDFDKQDVLTKLKRIWCQLLCTEVESGYGRRFHIDEDDNFYWLGGDSLVYKKMVACFNEAFPGVPFPVQGFFRQPTIHYLSTIIHMSKLERRDLIDLNRMPSATGFSPVHFIHPLLGDAFGVYSLIATALVPRPAFGISARTLVDPQVPADLGLIAMDYMADIEAIHQPPYVVVGWSAGGVILHEMVRQWHERQVPVLSIMFDSVSPRYMQTLLKMEDHAKYIADMIRETYKVLYSDVGDEQVRQLSQALIIEIQAAVSKSAQITAGFACLRQFINQRPHKSVHEGILRTAETIVTAILLHSGNHHLADDQILVVAKDQFGKIDSHLGWFVNPEHQVRVLSVDGNHLSLVSGDGPEIPMVKLLKQHLPRLQNRFQLKEFLSRLHQKYRENYISFMSFLSAEHVSIPIISLRQKFIDGRSDNPISLEQFFKTMKWGGSANGFFVKLNSSFYSTHIIYADIIRSYLAGHLQAEYDLVVWIDITPQSEPFFKQSNDYFGKMIYNIAPSGRSADVDSSIRYLEDLIKTIPANVLVLVENAGRLLEQSKSKEAIVRLCCQPGIDVISDFAFRDFRVTHQFDNLVVIADQDKRRLDTRLRRPHDEDESQLKQLCLAESLLPVSLGVEKSIDPRVDMDQLCRTLSGGGGVQLNAQGIDAFIFEHSFQREAGAMSEVRLIKSDVRRTMASSDFVPREGLSLQQVSEHLSRISKKLKIILIKGVAGSGKTELAYHISESIFQNLMNCNTLLWFRFNEKGEFDGNSLKQLEITQGAPEEMAEQCRIGLKSRGPVVLVFDDLLTLGSVKDYVNLEETSGIIFVTTRHTQLTDPGRVVDWEIDLSRGFTEEESIYFLNRLTGLDDRVNAIALAGALDKLPLSLHIAGSYIKELLSEGESYQTYLEKLQGSPGSAATDFDKEQQFFWDQLDGSVLSGRPQLFKSVITLTFSKLTEGALRLLYFFSVLVDRNIPSDLFDIYCEKVMLRRAEKIKAIGQLHQYGLIWKDTVSDGSFYYFHIHQQTQHFARIKLKTDSNMSVVIETITNSLQDMLSEQWVRLSLNRKDNIVFHVNRFLFLLPSILPAQQDTQFNELARLYQQARGELMSVFSKLGRLDRVLLMCDGLLDADSESVDAHLLRADVYTQQEKYDLALQDLDAILSRNDQQKDALLQRAIVFSKCGQKLGARDILVKTRCQATDSVRHIVTYLKIYNSLAMPAKGLSVLESLKYDGLKPGIDIQCIEAVLLYHVGQPDEARTSFQKILANADETINKSDLFYYLGLIDLDAKRYPGALDFLQQALQHCQDNAILKARIQLYLGCAYAGLMRLDQALDIFAQIDPAFKGLIVPFIEIANRGLESCLARMIEAGYDINQVRISDYWTALFAAVKAKYFDCARLLLAHQANPSLPSKEGNIALVNALLYMELDMVQLLLKYSKNPKADVSRANAMGISAIFIVAQHEEGERLIDFIKDYVDNWDVRDLQGTTPLMHACVLGRVEVVRRLRGLGADPNARNCFDQTAVMFATQYSHAAIVRMLIDEFNADYSVTEQLTKASLLDLAKETNNQELVEYFKLKCIDSCQTDFNPMIQKRYHDFLIKLLKTQGVQVTSTNAALVEPLAILPIVFEDEEMLDVMLVVSNVKFDVRLQYGITALHLAVASASLEILEKILNIRGINVNVLNCDDETPLHTAAQNNRADHMHLLVPRGAKVDSQNKHLQTPLMQAAATGAVDALITLIDVYNADVMLVDEDGDTALACAAVSVKEHCDDCIVKLAQHQNTLIDAENKKGLTALMYAILRGLINRMNLLVSLGADINKVSSVIHMTPLIFALLRGKIEEAKFLIECDNIDLNKGDADDDTPLNLACQAGQIDVVQLLCLRLANLNKPNRFGRTPMMSALKQDYSEIINILFDHNADLSDTDLDGETVLHQAVRKNNSALAAGFALRMPPDVLNHCNHAGLTALMLAALLDLPAVIKALLDQGANPDVPDNDGDTLLLTLLKMPGVEDELLLYVIQKTGNLGLQNFAGQSAILLATAMQRSQVVEALIARNVPLTVKDKEGNNLIAVAAVVGAEALMQRFIDLDVSIDEPNREGDTPLMMAAAHGNFTIVSVLIAMGAKVNHANIQGVTALLHAITRNHENILDVLMDNDANVDVCNITGSTPLMVAATMGYVNVLKKIVPRTTDINAMNNLGINAVTLADMEQKTDAVRYLQSQGAVLLSLSENHINAVRRQALEETKKLAIHLIERGITAAMINDEIGTRLLKEAIFIALQFDDTDTLELFFLLGMTFNIEHESLKKTALRVVTEKCSAALMRFCLDHGADLLFVDSKGKTLLGHVVLNHEVEHCRFLLPFYSELSGEIKENCLMICVEKIVPQTQDFKRALLFYSTLSAIMPHSTHYHQNYACYLAAQGNGFRAMSGESLSDVMRKTMEFSFQEAERQFKLALSGDPTSSTWADYGNFLFGQGKGDEVLAVLHQARVLQDNGGNSYSALELPNLDLYLRNAVNYYNQINLSPWILATWLLIQYHVAQGDVAEATKLLQEERWQKPTDAHLMMSIMLQGFGFYLVADYDNALARLNRFKLDRRSDQIGSIIADCEQQIEARQAVSAAAAVSTNPQAFWSTMEMPRQFFAQYGYALCSMEEALDFYSVVYQQLLCVGLPVSFESVNDLKAGIINHILTTHPESVVADEDYLAKLDAVDFSGDEFVIGLLPEILPCHVVILNADTRQPELMKGSDQTESILVLGRIDGKYKVILQDTGLTARRCLSDWVQAELQVKLRC